MSSFEKKFSKNISPQTTSFPMTRWIPELCRGDYWRCWLLKTLMGRHWRTAGPGFNQTCAAMQELHRLALNLASPLLLFFFLINLFIYFWLRWVFIAARGLSLVVASRGYSSLLCAGFSLRWLLLCGAQGLGAQALVVAARGLSSWGSRAVERRLSICGTRT